MAYPEQLVAVPVDTQENLKIEAEKSRKKSLLLGVVLGIIMGTSGALLAKEQYDTWNKPGHFDLNK